MVEFQRPRDGRDQENLEKIGEHLSREGVLEVLKRVDQKFQRQLGGRTLFYGVTPDGLVVGVRKGCDKDFGPDYWKAMAVDIKLPVDQIEQQMVEASLPHMSVDVYRDGGTSIFPGKEMLPVFVELSKMSDEEIKAKYPDDERILPRVRFYRQTGGFHFPTPVKPSRRSSVGGRTVYPLNLS